MSMNDERLKKARAEWREQQKNAAVDRRLFELMEDIAASPRKLGLLVVLLLVLLALWLLPR